MMFYFLLPSLILSQTMILDCEHKQLKNYKYNFIAFPSLQNLGTHPPQLDKCHDAFVNMLENQRLITTYPCRTKDGQIEL